MQLSSKVQGYFGHVTMEFAISKGWDFEQDLAEFYKDIDLNVPYMGLSTGQEITEGDVFKASQGEVTPGFAKFWLGLTLKEDAPEDGVVMQSMHSGSSDYLFVSDVKELQEIAKNVLA
ncbi:hypothetical protein BNKMLPFJ_00122 [Escherichia phage vB_EcoS-26175IV]|uniref:Uncharacterized protein n=1 Tax=Escherichia phage vB_EcoS-26175I TaxID=2576478 RepID=A0A5P1M7W1_9CAUD|nr:hypothetical protein [Salmonella enterica]QDK00010.1 hypothetical protein HEDJPLGI_00101 [Escherichia phage vB_EcoS-26175I]QDK00287.1 hypothetical protein INCEGHDL_00062 [Escherichia phage vB_EcoS-26175III]QDK00505.1 hypothetical protein BNKMLPFJ_00122 [Escherichia phage vB_EcoS-26175IV]WJZ69729.1 hypothetical protein YZUL1_79 [Citrobacter phage YZU-L1]